MLDVAIVGGGVCGLTLARDLAARGLSFAVFEARGRLGGRVLSVANATIGDRLDLGPAWHWPDTQPEIVHLLAELGVETFDQYDPGSALILADPEEPPETRAAPRLHSGARRIAGGMSTLVERLAETLPPDSIHLRCVLVAVERRADHVLLTIETNGARSEIAARKAVLAAPPRLLAENVTFAPPIAGPALAALRGTPTWMAAQAKAVVGFSGPPAWRAAGQSGNAFVAHEQATLGETFDACDASGEKAALGGFFALSAEQREAFAFGLPMLVDSQFVQLFGMAVEGGEQRIQDWAAEVFTCAAADKVTFDGGHPDYGSPHLARPFWDGALYFGGSETAARGGGYVEGAIVAALRIAGQLAQEEAPAAASPAPGDVNAASLAEFTAFVAARRGPAFESYKQRLKFALSRGQREQLTQRAMLGAMEAVFADALTLLEELPFDPRGVAVERGRSELTPKIQAAFAGFIQGLLDEIVAFNRASCALSNFPHEHELSAEYVSTTLRDIGAAWREFSLAANTRLLETRGTARAVGF